MPTVTSSTYTVDSADLAVDGPGDGRWYPDVAVSVDGTPVAGDQLLEGLTIHRGRDGIDEQPRAGYLQVRLLDLDASMPRVPLDARVTVTVDGTVLATDADVSDSGVELIAYHADGARVALHTLRALGRLARLHRADQLVELPAQHDGDRIAAILDAVDLAGTPLDIDTPGQFALAALDEPTDPWQAMQRAADDGLGQLAEHRDGGLSYRDAHARTALVHDHGFLELPAEAVVAPELSMFASVGDLANRVRVRWLDDGERAEAVAEDADKIAARGGVLEYRVDTTLTDETDAQDRADRLLELRRVEAASLDRLLVRLEQLTPTRRAEMLALEVGTPIKVTGLPAVIGHTFRGVVEALTWTISRTTAALELQVSDWVLSAFRITWAIVDPAHQWNNIDPSLTWNDADELAD